MIGSTELQTALAEALRGPIEKWEDSLTPDNDDFVFVDGEEGDYGIISYFGLDAVGVNVRMMVKYVHGGDSESTYYTQAGIAHMRTVLLGGYLAVALGSALSAVADPKEGEGGLRIGAIKAAKEAQASQSDLG